MKKVTYQLVLVLALALAAAGAYGADKKATQIDQSGVSGEKSEHQASMSGGSGGKMEGKQEVKKQIGPHALMIETSLMSARDQVKGIRAQLQDSTTVDAPIIAHAKMGEKELKDDLSMVRTHQAELNGAVKSLPEVAQAQEFKDANRSLTEVENFQREFAGKTQAQAYWQNRSQAMADLDQFEKKISDALSQTKSLESKYNIQSVG